MVEPRAGSEKEQTEPETSCIQRMMGMCQKDIKPNLKGLPLAKCGKIWENHARTGLYPIKSKRNPQSHWHK